MDTNEAINEARKALNEAREQREILATYQKDLDRRAETAVNRHLITQMIPANILDELCAKYPLYSQERERANTIVSVKLFVPRTACAWYLTECSREGNSYTGFGLAHISETKLGYIDLAELARLGVNVGGKVIQAVHRDKNFTPCTLSEAAKTEPLISEWLKFMGWNEPPRLQ